METKQDIRKKIFALRKQCEEEQLKQDSHAITMHLIQTDVWKNNTWIYAYMDCKQEVMTAELLQEAWKQGKRTAVPRVRGEYLDFYEITTLAQCESGYFHVPEPKTTQPLAAAAQALVIVPGVAFDVDRHRVGYGKGFYDRFLAAHPDYQSVAIACSWQVLDQVPSESCDICPELLITEDGIR